MCSADSQLKVWKLSGGRLSELLVLSEVGELWKRFDINITSPEEYQVRPSRPANYSVSNLYTDTEPLSKPFPSFSLFLDILNNIFLFF